MRHRIAIACSMLVLLLGLGATGAAAAATAGSAGGSLNAVAHAKPPAASAGAAATVDPIFCAGTGSGLCLNRKSCHSTVGTQVIMWAHDFDSCEDFGQVELSTMCGGGSVTSTCPFTVGSGLNTTFLGYPIEAIKAYNEGKCLATDSNGNGVLGTCPDSSGNGGSNGTIVIFANNEHVVSRYWSDANFALGEYDTPAYTCSPGTQGVQVILNAATATTGYCQWATVYSS
jgi:hypothetical protein